MLIFFLFVWLLLFFQDGQEDRTSFNVSSSSSFSSFVSIFFAHKKADKMSRMEFVFAFSLFFLGKQRGRGAADGQTDRGRKTTVKSTVETEGRSGTGV